MVRFGAAIAVVVVLAVLLFGFVTGGSVEAASSVDPDVTIECTGSMRLSVEACGARGDAVLSEGAPSHTFEMDDLARLRFDRELWGFGSTCEARYYLERYADDPAWTEEVACAPN
ncbi:MAG: hypothetical protein ACRDGD_08705 [Candidatus Limnocylindria bacterium]